MFNICGSKWEIFKKKKISWKDIVIGVSGDNLIVLLRNFLYSIIVYALYKNWCKNIDKTIEFDGNMKVLKSKYMLLDEMQMWKLILRGTSHPIKDIMRLWTTIVLTELLKVSHEY